MTATKSPGLPRARSAFAGISPGLEPLLSAELTELGVPNTPVGGGVSFAADAALMHRVVLHSRLAARVTLVLSEGKAVSLDQLHARVRECDWSGVVHPHQPVEVRVSSRGNPMRRKEPVEKKVLIGVQDALRGPRLPGPRAPREPVHIVLRLDGERATLAVDVAGERMHKRGYRQETAKAPLRENLAAALLRAAGWRPGEALVDPLCGSGTFSIEAASWSAGRAPGLGRTFDFERWPAHDPARWKKAVAEAERASVDPAAPIWASDRDPGAVEAARHNAARAGFERRIALRQAAFAEVEPPARTGLVVMNPPWGSRIGEASSLGRIYRPLGASLRERWVGWRVGLLLPHPRHLGAFGLRLEEAAQFNNGGVPVWWYVGKIG